MRLPRAENVRGLTSYTFAFVHSNVRSSGTLGANAAAPARANA